MARPKPLKTQVGTHLSLSIFKAPPGNSYIQPKPNKAAIFSPKVEHLRNGRVDLIGLPILLEPFI